MIKMIAIVASLGLVMASGGCPKEGAPKSPAQHQGHQNDQPMPNPDPKPTPTKTKSDPVFVSFTVSWNRTTSPCVNAEWNIGHGIQKAQFCQKTGPVQRSHQWGGGRSVNRGQTITVLVNPKESGVSTNMTVKAERQVPGKSPSGVICTDTNIDAGGFGGVSCTGVV